jgi:hypothetical protein
MALRQATVFTLALSMQSMSVAALLLLARCESGAIPRHGRPGSGEEHVAIDVETRDAVAVGLVHFLAEPRRFALVDAELASTAIDVTTHQSPRVRLNLPWQS